MPIDLVYLLHVYGTVLGMVNEWASVTLRQESGNEETTCAMGKDKKTIDIRLV